MNPLTSALATLGAGKGLSTSESRSAFASLLDGEASDIVAAAFLTALRVKGETADELEGAVAAVRERMIRWESGIGCRFAARYVRDRGRRCRHCQYLHGGGDRRGGLRRAGRQAWQPRGHRALRQLRRPVRPGRRDQSGAGLVAPLPGRAENHLPVRPDVPPRAGPDRAGATSTPVPNDLQPGRAAVQPRQSLPPTGGSSQRKPGGACRAGPLPAGAHSPRRRRDRMRRTGRSDARWTNPGLGRRGGQGAARGLASRGLWVESTRRRGDQDSRPARKRGED